MDQNCHDLMGLAWCVVWHAGALEDQAEGRFN